MIPQGLIHMPAVLLALSFTVCQKSATEVYSRSWSRGSINFYTQRNYPSKYEANIIFEPILETKGGRKLDNRYGY